MKFAVTFDDNTCPKCGKTVLKSNNLYGSQQLNTIDTYKCSECRTKLPIHWKPTDDSNIYEPCPLYDVSKIETFKSLFYEKEK